MPRTPATRSVFSVELLRYSRSTVAVPSHVLDPRENGLLRFVLMQPSVPVCPPSVGRRATQVLPARPLLRLRRAFEGSGLMALIGFTTAACQVSPVPRTLISTIATEYLVHHPDRQRTPVFLQKKQLEGAESKAAPTKPPVVKRSIYVDGIWRRNQPTSLHEPHPELPPQAKA